MSKLHLINEITTVVKMTTVGSYEEVKLQHYLDDILSNYDINSKDEVSASFDNAKYIKVFIDSLKVENYSDHTLKNYTYELKRFCKFIDKSLLKAKTTDVRQYLASYDDVMQSTIVTKLDTISSFYSWLVREEELLKNPCDKIKRPKVPKKVREGLTVIELEQVRAACIKVKKVKLKGRRTQTKIEDDVRKRALVEVMYSTACRLDELHKLNIEDIDWSTGAVIVCGKGSKERRVYLSEKAKFYLKRYLQLRTDDYPALFVTDRAPIGRLNHSGIQYQIKCIAAQANLNRSLHPHIFRHTFAQQALNSGMPMEDLQAYLGHEKADTTARYAQVTDERKFAAFKRYHAQ